MMTAHVVYSALDPDRPASISPTVHHEVIRGELGFDGLLMSDDLSMKALDGSMAARTAAVVAAGSDVALHCNGDLGEMEDVAANVPQLSERGRARLEVCANLTREVTTMDLASCEEACAEALAMEHAGREMSDG